ncbi:MAG: hypothetical protein NC320_09790 [Clostridium sp.]|nr:hypothetical protein [Clostridium sp.]
MKKDLKYFMQSDDEPEIISVEGIERFKDEEGNVIPLDIEVLSQEKIQKITDAYTERRIATDKRGNPIIASNGDVAYKVKKDSEKMMRRLIVEALKFPNLKAPEIMDFHKCVDITEMPLKVFRKAAEYQYVARMVMSVNGLGSFGIDEEELIEEAKN